MSCFVDVVVKAPCGLCISNDPQVQSAEGQQLSPVSVTTRDLRRGSRHSQLLGLWVLMLPGNGYVFLVSVVCCQVEVPG